MPNPLNVLSSPTRRRALLLSMVVTLIAFLLLGWLMSQLSKADERQLAMASASRTEQLFNDMVLPARRQLLALDKLRHLPCSELKDKLAKMAALEKYTRSIAVFYPDHVCHSFLGHLDENRLATWAPPELIHQPLTLVASNPIVQDRPALLLWRGEPDLSRGVLVVIEGLYFYDLLGQASRFSNDQVALVVGSKAMLGLQKQVVDATSLAPALARIKSPQGFEVQISDGHSHSSASHWRWLLAALVAGLLGLFCYFALNRREGPKAELKRAMERNEFFLHYQPVLALEDLSVTGAEVLMRWRHPVQGLIAPDIFIRAAEDTGLIVELTRHLFTLLEKELAQWEGGRFKLGVNLAAEHLHDGTLTRDLLALKGRLPANIQLVAELTERQLIGEDPLVLKQLQDCRAAGIQIAIDDFGTGHSSLAYLERLPVDYLKIDKSFVSALDSGSVQAPVLEAIIQLGHRLGMELLAEGIETERQAQFLRAKGVEYGQGYFYARPMPAPTLRQWLATAGSAAAANLTALRKEAGKKPD